MHLALSLQCLASARILSSKDDFSSVVALAASENGANSVTGASRTATLSDVKLTWSKSSQDSRGTIGWDVKALQMEGGIASKSKISASSAVKGLYASELTKFL